MTGSNPRTPFQYDPFDPVTQADPYPTYQALRDDHPVYWSHASHSWVLSRHADVGAALDDPATFSSASGIYPTPRGIDMTQLFLPMMIMTDPPRHSYGPWSAAPSPLAESPAWKPGSTPWPASCSMKPPPAPNATPSRRWPGHSQPWSSPTYSACQARTATSSASGRQHLYRPAPTNNPAGPA